MTSEQGATMRKLRAGTKLRMEMTSEQCKELVRLQKIRLMSGAVRGSNGSSHEDGVEQIHIHREIFLS
eukprot:8803671-Pyramimonas_sp.AAC.1